MVRERLEPTNSSQPHSETTPAESCAGQRWRDEGLPGGSNFQLNKCPFCLVALDFLSLIKHKPTAHTAGALCRQARPLQSGGKLVGFLTGL